jgi:hypothetical protein
MGWILALRKPSPPLSIIRNAKFRILPPQPASPVSTGQHAQAPQNRGLLDAPAAGQSVDPAGIGRALIPGLPRIELAPELAIACACLRKNVFLCDR